MNTRYAGRAISLLVAPLLFFLASCDSAEGPETETSSADMLSYKIDCYMPDGADQPAFLATGAIEDTGIVEGEPLPWNPEPVGPESWSGRRILRGAKGNIWLFVDAELAMRGSLLAEGTYTVLYGSGAYADFGGDGEFNATVDEKGDLEEIFLGEAYRTYR